MTCSRVGRTPSSTCPHSPSARTPAPAPPWRTDPVTIKLAGDLLTASLDTRTLTYRLLPFGEPGRTNVGTITASKGSVTLPDNLADLVGNIEHEGTRPVSRAVSLDETDDGL